MNYCVESNGLFGNLPGHIFKRGSFDLLVIKDIPIPICLDCIWFGDIAGRASLILGIR